MVKLILLGTSGCHLCEKANALLCNLLSEQDLCKISYIDIAVHQQWQAKYALRIPILYHLKTKKELAWPFDADQVLTFINTLSLKYQPMSKKYRMEQDSMGELQVPMTALYAAQTQRAINNFPVSGLVLPMSFIRVLALIKKNAAKVNQALGHLDAQKSNAIIKAAEQVMAGKHSQQFPVDVFQTGSGTSTNMNVNEVLAHIASDISGTVISANDHVNMGQSSNDVIPTAIHVSAAVTCNSALLPKLHHLAEVIDKKALSLANITKTGRTHLMDAMPLTMEQELGAWGLQIRHGIERINATLPRVYKLAQGGTAVGTGINADSQFATQFNVALSAETGLPFTANTSFFESLSAQDTMVELSSQMKVIAVSLMKIANDLRWMNSGPLAGLGEIELTPLQPGSSIMPGKVNPVIPESVAMVAAQVIGNDATITVAGQSGIFQLNVMLPVIAYNILQSIDLIGNAANILADKAIATFRVREHNLQVALAKNPILVTALNTLIGYTKAAKIAKTAYQTNRPIIDVAEEMTDLSRMQLEKLLDPHHLTKGGMG